MDQKPVKNRLPERLEAARIAAGLSQKSLAKIVGVGQSTIAQIESGIIARPKRMREIAAAVHRSEEWLLGEVDSQTVPAGYEFSPDPDPDAPATIGSETGIRGIPKGTLPQVDVTGGLGSGGLTQVSDGIPGRSGMTFAAEHIADYWRLPANLLGSMGAKPGDIAIIPVQGDSMAGTLVEGDCVFVDTRHRLPSPDGLYALSDEFGGIIVKRLEMASNPGTEEPIVRVISDNPRHAPKDWPLSEVRIVGRVLRKFGVVT